MATPVTCKRVFLASPGGVEADREAVAEVIDEFNRIDMTELRAAYVLETWEKVPGGVGRGQALINELLRECDYLILILWDRWGSPTGLDNYSSGTEEEFRLAERLLTEAGTPMSDILILFKGVPTAQLRDPGAQLQKVLDFKAEIEASRRYLFKTFDTHDELRAHIRSQLSHWAKNPARAPAGAGAAAVEPLPGDLSLLEMAEQLADRGLTTRAEAVFAKAVADDDVVALKSYAKFLRRSNRLAASLSVNEKIISLMAGDSSDAALEATADALASVGIILRKRDHLEESRYRLLEAVETLRSLPASRRQSLPYVLDNLGTTYRRLGDFVRAEGCYMESLRIREEGGDESGLIDAYINLGRMKVHEDDLQAAQAHFATALEAAERLGTDAQVATCLAADAEVDGRRGDFESALAKLERAVGINERMGRPGAVGLVMTQIARMRLGLGDFGGAEQAIDRAIREHELVGSVEGASGARLIKSEILLKAGRLAEALRIAQSVEEEHRRAGGGRLMQRAVEVIGNIEAFVPVEASRG